MSVKLTPTQQSLLTAAAEREDRIVTLPANLRGGAAVKVVDGLLNAGLARRKGDYLVATNDGLRAVGVEPPRKAKAEPAVKKAAAGGPSRENSKQAQLIEMLKRPEGASIAEITAAFGWQAHTARGAISGALKKKLGLTVVSEKVDGRGRIYKIPAEG
ncbi:MAG: DUF3489 domain-containing protein [Alphaproteobacteria bacterium]|nr:DUF3489 domain-containing protein [Alphaproteobacteria bacterium]